MILKLVDLMCFSFTKLLNVSVLMDVLIEYNLE